MEPSILYRQLLQYADGGLYPLHMPGHKRRLPPGEGLPFDWDVTEVPGTDDLHEAEEILAEAMQRTAALYGSSRCWHLVGGSTVGLLAAIRALAPAGSTVVAARNCHKSVYHAIELGGLRPHWLVPPVLPGYGIYGSIAPQQVADALAQNPGTACVILTSPTYEGVLSDIGGIAAVCHAAGVPLLVDEAHGAHLGLFEGGYFPAGAVACGADVVVQSAHKTLPSLTQTAWLHLRGSRVDAKKIERQLDVFETSSPSYPLLASLDGCTGLLRQRGAELFAQWRAALQGFDSAVSQLKRLRLLGHGNAVPPLCFGLDPSKILVSCGETAYTGAVLAEALRSRFGFETEMSCGPNLLAMTSCADDPAALQAFAHALCVLDAEAQPGTAAETCLPPPGRAVCTAAAAVAAPQQTLPAEKALGCVSAEYIWAYPPGVPLVAPGEEITPALLQAARGLTASGTRLRHTGAKDGFFCCMV